MITEIKNNFDWEANNLIHQAKRQVKIHESIRIDHVYVMLSAPQLLTDRFRFY